MELIYERIKFLHKRYETFTFVINYVGVYWDEEEEYIRASHKTWIAMMRVSQLHIILLILHVIKFCKCFPSQANYFAIVYYLRDEPQYSILTHVFGPGSANFDDMGEVEGPTGTVDTGEGDGPSDTAITGDVDGPSDKDE